MVVLRLGKDWLADKVTYRVALHMRLEGAQWSAAAAPPLRRATDTASTCICTDEIASISAGLIVTSPTCYEEYTKSLYILKMLFGQKK